MGRISPRGRRWLDIGELRNALQWRQAPAGRYGCRRRVGGGRSLAAGPALGRSRSSGFRGHTTRSELVDCLRQNLRQLGGQVLRCHPNLGSQLLHRVRAKGLMNLVRADRLIGTGSHPRAYGVAQSLLLQLRDDTLNAAVLFDDAIDDGDHFGTDRSTQQSVDKSHVKPLLRSDSARLESTLRNQRSPKLERS